MIKKIDKEMKFIIRVILALFCLLGSSSVEAQNYAETLRSVIDSSRSLRVLRGETDAEKNENMTGLNLPNPEAEVSHEWGSPAGVPPRTIVSLNQAFNFSVLTGASKRLSEAKNNQSELRYQAARLALTQQVDELMTNIVYYNRLEKYYSDLYRTLEKMKENVQRGIEHGQKTIVDLSLIKVRMSEIESQISMNHIESEGLQRELALIAGRESLGFSSSEYYSYSLPEDINSELSKIGSMMPELMLAAQEVAIADRNVELRKSEGLPSFSLGYTSELVKDANYFGVKAGVELPLWANKGRVKAAEAAKSAKMLAQEDAELNFRSRMLTLYKKSEMLKQLTKEVEKLRDDATMRSNLEKMYELGKFSMHEYLVELLPIMDLDLRVINAEHDYQLALAAFRGGRDF